MYLNEFLHIVDLDDCMVSNGGCSYKCKQTPRGAECICPDGHELNGTKECIGMVHWIIMHVDDSQNEHENRIEKLKYDY